MDEVYLTPHPKSDAACSTEAQLCNLSAIAQPTDNRWSIAESEQSDVAYFPISDLDFDKPWLLRKVRSAPELPTVINCDPCVLRPIKTHEALSARKPGSPHVIKSAFKNSEFTPTSIPPSPPSSPLASKHAFRASDDSSNSIAGSADPEIAVVNGGEDNATEMTARREFSDMNAVLPQQRTRTFYCREWVFDKILRHLKALHQTALLKTCFHMDELDTVTETATAISGSTLQHTGKDYPTSAQPSRKLVLVGGPGSGKTTICRRIVNSQPQVRKMLEAGHSLHTLPLCVQVSAHLLATHFCTVQLQDSLDPVTFVRSLYDQIQRAPIPLAARFTQLMESDSSPYSHYLTRDRIRTSPDEAFRYGILGALNAAVNASLKHPSSGDLVSEDESSVVHFYPGIRQLFILVDGVDECASQLAQDHAVSDLQRILVTTGQDTRRESQPSVTGSRKSKTIFELLVNNVQHFPDWLMLFITCRRQNRNVISRTFSGIRRISIDDLHRSAVGHDVQQYLLSRLASEHDLQFAFRSHMHSDFLGLLRIKSSACMLYLETLLDALSELWVKPEQLAQIPGTLNGLYLWLCQCLFSSNTEKHVSCPTYFPLVRPLLEVLLATPQPISEQELFDILSAVDPSFSLDDYRSRLKLLRTVLVTMTSEEERKHLGPVFLNPESDCRADLTRNIHFFHSSFAEWLLDVKHCTVVYLCNLEHGRNLIEHALEGRVHMGRLGSSPMMTLPPTEVAGERLMSLSGLSKQQTVDSDRQLKDPVDSIYTHTNYTSDSLQLLEPGDHRPHHMTVGPNDSLVLAARKGELDKVRTLLEKKIDVNQLDEDGWSALRTASWRGHMDIVDLLLTSGADVNLSGPDGRSALRAASWAGHEEIVERLLDAGANVNQQDAEGRSPLIAAAYMGHVGVVEILAQAGADLNHADEDGRTALHVAAFCVRSSETHHEVVSCLLECGANPNVFDCEGITPLLGAARAGNRTVCELCLEADTDVNQADKCGNTALSLAVLGGHTSVVRLLLFWGAAVDGMDAAGRSLLSLAAAIGSGPIVQELLARGLDEAHRDHAGCTPLHLAAAGPSSATSANCETEATPEQYCEVIRILLESGAHADDTDNSGRTPLLTACECNQVAAVEVLLSQTSLGSFSCHSPNRSGTPCSLNSTEPPGPYVLGNSGGQTAFVASPLNRPSLENQTPLRAAALCNNPDLVRILLAAGADPDYQDAYGRTTLYLLALEGMLDMADLLLHTPAPGAHLRPGSSGLLGANPVLSDDEGRCPLHVATWQGHLDMVKLLLQAGTPVDIRDREGRTPLQLAAWQGHASICQLLLEEGNARVDAVCSQGATSLCIAAQEGHLHVCSVLLQAGANPFQADSHGRTPYRVALKAGHVEICELLEQRYGSNYPSWFDQNGCDSLSPEGNQLRTVMDPVHCSAEPVVTNRGHSRMTAVHDYPRGAPIPLTSTPQMSGLPNPDQLPSTNASQQYYQQQPQKQQHHNQAQWRRDFGDDANPYARPPGPLAVRRFQQPSSDTSAHSESQKFIPSVHLPPGSHLDPSTNPIQFIHSDAFVQADMMHPSSGQMVPWQFTSNAMYLQSPGFIQHDPRTASFVPMVNYPPKHDTSQYDAVNRSAYRHHHHQQLQSDHQSSSKSMREQSHQTGPPTVPHHAKPDGQHPGRAAGPMQPYPRGSNAKVVRQDSRVRIEGHRVKQHQQKDTSHRVARSSRPDGRDSGTEPIDHLPTSVVTKKHSLVDDPGRHGPARTFHEQACYPDLLPHQFHQLHIDRDQGDQLVLHPGASPTFTSNASASRLVKPSSSMQATPVVPAKDHSQTPRHRDEKRIPAMNSTCAAGTCTGTTTTTITSSVAANETCRTTDDRSGQRDTSLPETPVAHHVLESKITSTRSALAGMLRFGNRRGKKSRKQISDSADVTGQSDCVAVRTKLKPTTQPKCSNHPVIDDSQSDDAGVARLPCINYPTRSTAEGNSTKPYLAPPGHDVSDKGATSSMQLEALARKLACCTQIEGVPQSANPTFISRSQMVSKPYSPQLWDRQPVRSDTNRPPL